uniref:(northern house mosquito) hypothetical protein n=1 Tax=Culex pipiens TaxID=7175 RepID=A0A8D8KNL7_CULPI
MSSTVRPWITSNTFLLANRNNFSLVLATVWSLNSRNNRFTTRARLDAYVLNCSCLTEICFDCNACETAQSSFFLWFSVSTVTGRAGFESGKPTSELARNSDRPQKLVSDALFVLRLREPTQKLWLRAILSERGVRSSSLMHADESIRGILPDRASPKGSSSRLRLPAADDSPRSIDSPVERFRSPESGSVSMLLVEPYRWDEDESSDSFTDRSGREPVTEENRRARFGGEKRARFDF